MGQVDNPQAFPSLKYQAIEAGEEIGEYAQDTGMTLRDYFAGQALAGLVSHYGNQGDESASKHCYQYADAMLKERSKHDN